MKSKLVGSLLLASLSASAGAATFTLDFEDRPSNTRILDFYNGGQDADGNSGTNYGVSFGTAAFSSDSLNGVAHSGIHVLGFYDSIFAGVPVINVANGFADAFSIYYTAPYVGGTIAIYSGVDKTGVLLGTLNLASTGVGPDPFNPYTTWERATLEFIGVARSIDLGGAVTNVVYDDVTFGSAVPEPATFFYLAIGAALILPRAHRHLLDARRR